MSSVNQHLPTSDSMPRFWPLAMTLVVLGSICWWQFQENDQSLTDQKTTIKTPVTQAPRPKVTARDIAGNHLIWAATQTRQRLQHELDPVHQFFDEARKNTPEFANRALSFSSKWRLIADYVPFTKGNRHETYLRQQFETILFTPQQLEKIVTTTVSNYQYQIESIENELLVRIRKSAANFPEVAELAKLNDKQLRAEYEAALKLVIANSQSDLQKVVGREVLSFAASEIMTFVAIRLGVSAGVLSAGAASGTVTFGIGVVVAIVVDQIVSWVWDWALDPRGELARELSAKFDLIEQTILVGDKEHPGLQPRLSEFGEARIKLRDEAILKLLNTHLE